MNQRHCPLAGALPASLLPQHEQVQAFHLFTSPGRLAQEFQARIHARVMGKAADRYLVGQFFPPVVRLKSAHDRLERHTVEGVARLFGASRQVVHARIVARYSIATGLYPQHQ